eukprot:CAMPEP_0171201176 /NCGR_PEP_ID=MMETSP0790-20130122/24358_1 /TAXON_ID=2925 /ORGANISM="Alexandrium catenella, Strain OF101" /LENGTH=90 /DNA_ID=CAMNT_0011666573 /DNA_START=16 /DNA_END=286 /DNA_ORIENTATION=+
MPPATLTLKVNGLVVGETHVEKSCMVLMDASETFDVGMDLGSSVSLDYDSRLPFRFTGRIRSLDIKYVHNSSAAARQDLAYIIERPAAQA